MAVEEVIGKPFAGKSEERVQALEARVAYLIAEVRRYSECALDSLDTCAPDTGCVLDSLKGDLAEARKQLADWRAQQEVRN